MDGEKISIKNDIKDNYSISLENLIYILSSFETPEEIYNKTGVTRKQIDNYNRRNGRNRSSDSYKNRYFGNKDMGVDEYTGKKVHYRTCTEKKRFKSERSAQTDHIVPIQQIIDNYSRKSFLTVEDIRDITNGEQNLAITNASINTSKKQKDNASAADILYQKGKIDEITVGRMKEKEVIAQKYIKENIKKRQINNASDSVVNGASRAIMADVVPIAFDILKNIYAIENGDKSVSDAIGDTTKEIAKVALSGGGVQLLTDSFTNSKNNVIKNIANHPEFLFLTVGIIMTLKDPILKYNNGMVEADEFKHEMIVASSTLIAGFAGRKVGEAVGVYIGEKISIYVAGKISEMIGGVLIPGSCAFILGMAAEATVTVIDNAIQTVLKEEKMSEDEMQYLEKIYYNMCVKYAFLNTANITKSSSQFISNYISINNAFEKLNNGIFLKNENVFIQGINEVANSYGIAMIQPNDFLMFRQFCMLRKMQAENE